LGRKLIKKMCDVKILKMKIRTYVDTGSVPVHVTTGLQVKILKI